MRTNIVIDDALMDEALRQTGLKTKREVAKLGLATLVRLRKQSALRDYRGAMYRVLGLFGAVDLVQVGGRNVAIKAALNFRRVRTRGVIVGRRIDTLIATRCSEDDYALLSSDRDFDPLVEHLGLRSAMVDVIP